MKQSGMHYDKVIWAPQMFHAEEKTIPKAVQKRTKNGIISR